MYVILVLVLNLVCLYTPSSLVVGETVTFEASERSNRRIVRIASEVLKISSNRTKEMGV